MKQVLAILMMLNAPFLPIHLDAQSMRIHPAPGLGGYNVPFYADGTYRPDIQSPDEFFGFTLGSRPVTHSEVVVYFEYLGRTFPNATLNTYGETYEGRRLIYLTVTSEENARKLDLIRDRISKLADPRTLKNDDEAQRIISETPAVAWMGYAIHGDELSSTDAALQLAYQLIAGTDDVSEKIRNNLVVCIDPLQNPDGRTRFLTQFAQFNSAVPSRDVQSFHHRGIWPWGRGNHYLFDLNRDWFALVHPETRGKVQAILSWHPQFAVDCHEMGAFDTYLFDPPREPFNPFLPPETRKWWDIFARDQAAAFDRYGWSYYTREWNEELYPGYGSSWPIYTGAVGILYEQAGVDGSQVKRPDGTTLTYRETVHHQFFSSLANLTTAADHRKELLQDYYAVRAKATGNGRTRVRNAAYLFPPGTNPSRLERFAETLKLQNIEVTMSKESFEVRGAVSRDGAEVREVSLPEKTLIVWLDQPNRNLAEAILAFDIRLNTDFLETQRKARLKHGRTEIYDVTGWSLALAYDVEAYYSESVPEVATVPLSPSEKRGGIVRRSPKVGYLFSGDDERALVALVRLLEKEVKVWCARKPFEVEGTEFPRGSFLIRMNTNRELAEETIEAIATDVGITIYGVNEGLATEGPDLGGGEFELLERPRIGLVGGSSVSTYGFGTVWHLLDSRISIPVSTLDISTLTGTDLAKYNVLVFPSVWGGSGTYKRLLGDVGIGKLKDWIKDGGTLVAMGSATAFLADTSSGLSSIRQKRQVLKKLADYEEGLRAAKEAESPQVDSLAIWEGEMPEEKEKVSPAAPDLSEVERDDELARKLSPQGVIMKLELDDEHWLGFGCGNDIPVMVNTSFAYLAKGNVEVAGRLASRKRIRLSGLLWPEARERWSETVWASREGMGKGQMILFATQPNFRGYFYGGERMLLNALLLGPGFGSRQTVEWR